MRAAFVGERIARHRREADKERRAEVWQHREEAFVVAVPVRIGSLNRAAEPQPFDLDFNTPVWLFFWTLKVERQKTRSADGSGVAVDDEAAAAMSCARSAAIARRKCVVPGTYDRRRARRSKRT